MPGRLRWPVAVLCGLAAAAMIGGAAAVPTAAVVALVTAAGLRRLESSGARRERVLAANQLPITADLLASALRAGASPDLAAAVVGASVPGPVGDRLVEVARALRLGTPVAQAWACLSPVPGADRIGRTAVRSADSGIALAGALGRLAEDLRASRAAEADAAARRVAVLGVIPLGLCFLPAFLLVGVVPVVTSVLSGVVGE